MVNNKFSKAIYLLLVKMKIPIIGILLTKEAEKYRRSWSERLFTLFVSTFVATLISSFYEEIPSWISLIFLSLVVCCLIYMMHQTKIDQFLWQFKQMKLLDKPKIGILKLSDGDWEKAKACTRFKPHDWGKCLKKEGFEVEYIHPSHISRKYTAIVNPYGEAYPEMNVLELETFKKIIDFVYDGGTFLCAGGYPFFYAYHVKTRRRVPLSEIATGLAGEIKGKLVILDKPVVVGEATLTDTLLWKQFRLRTTMGNITCVKTFQENSDRKFAGDLSRVGNTDYIEEFRAIREPAAGIFPFLRAKEIINDREIIIYPLAAIPYGKGFFMIAGINLDSNKVIKGSRLDETGFVKVVSAFTNFLRYQRIEFGL